MAPTGQTFYVMMISCGIIKNVTFKHFFCLQTQKKTKYMMFGTRKHSLHGEVSNMQENKVPNLSNVNAFIEKPLIFRILVGL